MADIAMRILLSAQDNVSKVISSVAKSLGSSGGGLAGSLSAMGAATLVVAGAAVSAAVGLGVASVKAAGDFQQAMANNVAHAGLAKDQVENVNKALIAMGPAVGQGPTELAKAMYPILSGFSGITNEAAKTQVSLAELNDAAKSVAGSTTDVTVVSKAASAAFNALGLGTNNAATNVQRMNTLFDQMNATVSAGNMQWSDYANVAGKLATSIAGTNVQWTEASAALATLTNEGYSAQRSQTYLANLFTQLDLKTDSLAKNARKLGLTFDEQKFKSMSLADQMTYLRQVTDGNQSSLLKLLNNNATALRTYNALSSGLSSYRSNLDSIKNSQGATAKAFADASNTWNFSWQRLQAAGQALLITIGSKLLPILSQLVNAVTPIVTAFTNWITSGHAVSDVLGWMHDHLAIVIPIVSIFAGVLLATLVPAILSLAAGVIAATWPFVLIGAAIAGAVLIFQHFYTTSKPFKAFIDNLIAGLKQLWSTIQANFVPAMQNAGNIVQTKVLPALQLVGSWLMSTFKPVWDQLVATIQGQVVPTWNSLVSAIRPVLPQLQTFAAILGGAVFGAISLVIGIIGGLIHGIASFVSGLIQVIGGVIQVFSGIVKVISGVISFIVDLATGKFGKLKGDIGLIFDGIGTIAHGMWEMIKGFFQEGIGAVVGFVTGFVQTIQGIFTSLANILVGHSIVPDMINAIVQFFADLPGRAAGAVVSILSTIGSIFSNLASQAGTQASNLVSGVVNWLSQLPGRAGSAIGGIIGTITGVLGQAAGAAASAGANIVNSIASGIEGAIGSVGAAIGDVASFISSHLPHSPAKVGPLRDLVLQGTLIARQISDGLMQGAPYLSNALQSTLAPVAAIGTHSPDSGVMADQLSFAGAPALIYSGKKKPVETTSAKKAQENRLKAAEKTVANEFKAIDAEMKALTKRESTKEANERKRYAAEIKAIEAHDKHLSGNAKKAGEEEIKLLREQEKRQLASERKVFEAKIRADRAKERQLKQEIHLQLTIHAYKADASEIDRIAEQAVKAFGDKIRQQFGNI